MEIILRDSIVKDHSEFIQMTGLIGQDSILMQTTQVVRREVTIMEVSVLTVLVSIVMKVVNSVLIVLVTTTMVANSVLIALATTMKVVSSVLIVLGGYNNGERSYTPRYNNDENGEQQYSFRPRYNSEGGEQRSFRPRQNGGGRFGKPNGRPMQRKVNSVKPNNHRPVEYTEIYTPDDDIRLNKFLANAGICSRREADEYIQAGVVTVNGEVVKELGTKIKRGDEVKFHDQPVSIERKIYVLLNKPKDCVTTTDDPQARKTVMDIVKNACPERIYPVGRLDRNTTGVLLLTNDGELASKLTHPKYEKKKIYRVKLDKDLTQEDMDKIVAGIELEDGEIHADEIAYADDTKKNDIGIEIHSGKNRIVRRIFEHLGYKVTKLDRVFFAGLTKKGLKRGDWRFLTQQEVNFLRMGSFA